MKIENIKFKAKKTLDGKWIKGDLVHHKDSDNVWMTDFEKRLTSPIDPSTICQFTGLKDCDGKEIFEGDILDFNGLTVEVRFVRGVFALLINGNLDEELCGDCRTDLFAKVIGNIYDNPDILKESKKLKN